MSTPDPTRRPPGEPRAPPGPPASSDKPEPSPQLTEQMQKQAQFRQFAYRSAIAVCIACPIVALMPPRKMDLFTFGLGVAFCTSAGYVLEERTGKGLVWHLSSQLPSVRRKERERLAREREEEEAVRVMGEEGRREFARLRREDWLERRKREEKDAIEEGRGYGSLILDHVREAFGGKKRSDADEEDDDHDHDANDKGKKD